MRLWSFQARVMRFTRWGLAAGRDHTAGPRAGSVWVQVGPWEIVWRWRRIK